MPMPLLRPQQPGDDPFLRQLHAASRDDLAMLPAALVDMQYAAQAAGYRAMYPAARYLIVERAGVPLGRAILTGEGDGLRLVDITLLPAARGAGIGTALMKAWQREAAARGMALRLSVLRTNERAHRLYAALGFIEEGGDAVLCRMVWRQPAQVRDST